MPLRRKYEKKRKDASKSGSFDIRIVASPVERLEEKAARKSQKVKEGLDTSKKTHNPS